ncbi:hypothetical protein HYW75_06270 [Candidatus Pacearchaeota archaeon]|nr:hypothetical protein [Candidatus Pacearchaeota archaeon]
MNKKGFELAISTIVILVIGILVVIGIIYAVTDGFKKFKNVRDPLLSSVEGIATKKACEIACKADDRITFCCSEQKIQGKNFRCSDERLGIDCNFACDVFVCDR